MARVLITGATGLIGREVARAAASYALVEVSRDDHDLRDGDGFVAAIREAGADVVLHLAWCASGSPGYRSSRDNELWARSSLRAAAFCLETGIHFVGTGTVVDADPGPDAYARSKHLLRSELATEIDAGRLTWIRPFYVFDPVTGRPALVADALASAGRGHPVVLRSGASSHDFIHVADVATAVVRVLEDDLRGSVDIGSGSLRTVREVALACGAEVADADAPTPPLHDVAADVSRLRAVGWAPTATEHFFDSRRPSHL